MGCWIQYGILLSSYQKSIQDFMEHTISTNRDDTKKNIGAS